MIKDITTTEWKIKMIRPQTNKVNDKRLTKDERYRKND